jgi:hypothetical protein
MDYHNHSYLHTHSTMPQGSSDAAGRQAVGGSKRQLGGQLALGAG